MKEELKEKLESFVIEEYEKEKGKKTIQSYQQEILFFVEWLPNDSKINKVLLIDFKSYLQDKFKPNTTNHYIVVINKFLKYCGYDIRLKKVKIQNQTSLNNQIEEADHKRMLRWAKKMELNDMYFIMKLFARSGLRVSEIKYFTIEKLDWNMEIKNKGKYREIIVPRDLLREIRKYCRDNKIRTGYVFRSPRNANKVLSSSTIWDRLKRIARRAKINPSKIHPHAWRHLFSKNALKAGVTLDELMDLLGHNDIRTTAIYTKTSSKEKRKKLETMKL